MPLTHAVLCNLLQQYEVIFSQVALVLGCFTEVALLGFLIFNEFKNPNKQLTKMLILILTAMFMLSKRVLHHYRNIDSGGHYLYYPDGILITVSLMSMEICRFLVFFLVCYYFTNKSANLLHNKEKWRCTLKIFLVVNIAWCICSGIINFIAYAQEWFDYK